MTTPGRTCYARSLGGCTEMSGEHYVSKTLLEKLGGPVVVEGYRRTPDGTHGINALTAKILCRAHNSALSDLDTELGRGFDAVRAAQDHLDAEAEGASRLQFELDGPKFERALLKVAFGLTVAGQLGDSSQGTRVTSLRPDATEDLLEILFGIQDWPRGRGLFAPHDQSAATSASRFADGSSAEWATEPLVRVDEQSLWAMHFWIRSVRVTLAFYGMSSFEKVEYRPAAFILTSGSGDRSARIRLSWPDMRAGARHRTVYYQRVGTLPE